MVFVALTFARLAVRLWCEDTEARFPERVAGDSTTAMRDLALPLASLPAPFVDRDFSPSPVSVSFLTDFSLVSLSVSFLTVAGADAFVAMLFLAADVRLLAATAEEPSVLRARVTKSVILLCPVDDLAEPLLSVTAFFGSGDDVGLTLSL